MKDYDEYVWNCVMTLADHAEAWAMENDIQVPQRDTEAWQVMYEMYIDYAFADLGKGKP